MRLGCNLVHENLLLLSTAGIFIAIITLSTRSEQCDDINNSILFDVKQKGANVSNHLKSKVMRYLLGYDFLFIYNLK